MEFNLADLWEAVVDAVPDREALVWGSIRLTFRETDERANRLAHFFRRRGLSRGDHVAVYLPNRPEYLETMLAAFKLGAVPINVNYRYVADELRYLFDDADIKAVVTSLEFLPLLNDVANSVPMMETVVVVDGSTTPAGFDMDRDRHYETVLGASSPERGFGPRFADDRYIVYTGGTTGMPKGVVWRSADIFFAGIGGGNPSGDPIERPDDIVEHLDRPIRALPVCPLMHGTANWFAFRILLGGGSLVLSTDRKFDPVRTWQLISSEQVAFIVIVGDAFARPLVDALDLLDSDIDLGCLRWVLSSGAIFTATVKQSWVERMTHLRLIDGFGSSETGTQGEVVTVRQAEGASRAQFRLRDDVQVLDDNGQPTPPGTPGRLARRGHIPLGYYKDAEKSKATFPVIDGVRWSIPGDYAVRHTDGTITVLGRGSVCINTGGEKVFPEEVEAALKSHSEVLDVLVVGVPDPRWGEQVVAVVAPRPGRQPSLQQLNDLARQHVAGYKLPKHLVLVDQIQRTPSGKPNYAWAKEVASEQHA